MEDYAYVRGGPSTCWPEEKSHVIMRVSARGSIGSGSVLSRSNSDIVRDWSLGDITVLRIKRNE